MAIVIDAEQREAAFKAAGSDLLFLLDRKQVDSEFQAKLDGAIEHFAFAVFICKKQVAERRTFAVNIRPSRHCGS